MIATCAVHDSGPIALRTAVVKDGVLYVRWVDYTPATSSKIPV